MEQQNHPGTEAADTAQVNASAQHAVQVALDRRDNGGDAQRAGQA